MNKSKPKPRWWQMYAMLPALAGLFLVEMRLPLTSTEHIVAQLGILALMYAFVHAWLGANRRALMELDDVQDDRWVMRVYQIPRAEIAESKPERAARTPRLPVPQSEIQGVLSTTFHVDEFEDETAYPAGSDTLFSEERMNTKSDRL